MFTSRNPITRHGSIFRNEKTKQICQIMCVSTHNDKDLFILANFHPYPFEIIREWDATTLNELRDLMHESEEMYRYMGEVSYLAEAE